MDESSLTTNVKQEDEVVDLEEHFILRLPQNYAKQVRKSMRKLKSKRFKKYLTINFHPEPPNVSFRRAEVKIGNRTLQARLFNLPCITDSSKTCDKTTLFKLADVSQILVCREDEFGSDEDEENKDPNNLDLVISNNHVDCKKKENGASKKAKKDKKYLWPHGIAPPMKNVRKQRFRKCLKCVEDPESLEQIEKEVMLLLKTDNHAVATRFEIFYEEPKQPPIINEVSIFGEEISDTDSSEENS